MFKIINDSYNHKYCTIVIPFVHFTTIIEVRYGKRNYGV